MARHPEGISLAKAMMEARIAPVRAPYTTLRSTYVHLATSIRHEVQLGRVRSEGERNHRLLFPVVAVVVPSPSVSTSVAELADTTPAVAVVVDPPPPGAELGDDCGSSAVVAVLVDPSPSDVDDPAWRPTPRSLAALNRVLQVVARHSDGVTLPAACAEAGPLPVSTAHVSQLVKRAIEQGQLRADGSGHHRLLFPAAGPSQSASPVASAELTAVRAEVEQLRADLHVVRAELFEARAENQRMAVRLMMELAELRSRCQPSA